MARRVTRGLRVIHEVDGTGVAKTPDPTEPQCDQIVTPPLTSSTAPVT